MLSWNNTDYRLVSDCSGRQLNKYSKVKNIGLAESGANIKMTSQATGRQQMNIDRGVYYTQPEGYQILNRVGTAWQIA